MGSLLLRWGRESCPPSRFTEWPTNTVFIFLGIDEIGTECDWLVFLIFFFSPVSLSLVPSFSLRLSTVVKGRRTVRKMGCQGKVSVLHDAMQGRDASLLSGGCPASKLF